MWVVFCEVAYVAFDSFQAPLNWFASRPGSWRGLCEPDGVFGGTSVHHGRGLYDHAANSRGCSGCSGKKIHGSDYVDLVHGTLRHLRGVHHQERVNNRVHPCCSHNSRENRIVGVYANVFSPFKFNCWLGGVEADNDLDCRVCL